MPDGTTNTSDITASTEPDRLIAHAEVCQLTSLSRTSIWRLEKAHDFPHRRRIGPNRVAWKLSEIRAWLESRQAVA